MKRKYFILLFGILICLCTLFTGCGKQEKYKIEFVVDNGTYATIETAGNEQLELPTEPTKTGFDFGGWYFDLDTWQQVFSADSFINKSPKNDTKVYAKWIEHENESLNANFEGFDKIDNLTYSKKVSNTTENVYLTDYVSVDRNCTWKLCTNIQATDIIPSKVATLNVGNNTYYVLVEDSQNNVKIYTLQMRRKPLYEIVFDTDGGNEIESQFVEEDSFLTIPLEPIKKGYTFVRWDFDFSNAITQNTIIYANWTAKTYTIYFDSILVEAERIEPMVVKFNEEYTIDFVLPNVGGYDFSNWSYEDATFEKIKYIYDHDITLTAVWNTIFETAENQNKELTIVSLTDYGKTLSSILIPLTIDNKKVTEIYTCALVESTITNNGIIHGSNTTITNLTVSQNITKIYSKAFSYCDNLRSIKFLGTIKQWIDINKEKFIDNNYDLYLNDNKITHIDFSSIDRIPQYAFYNCSSIETINIGDNVQSIEDGAFYNCVKIKKVFIPRSVISIGSYIFYKTSSWSDMDTKIYCEASQNEFNNNTNYASTWRVRGYAGNDTSNYIYCTTYYEFTYEQYLAIINN